MTFPGGRDGVDRFGYDILLRTNGIMALSAHHNQSYSIHRQFINRKSITNGALVDLR